MYISIDCRESSYPYNFLFKNFWKKYRLCKESIHDRWLRSLKRFHYAKHVDGYRSIISSIFLCQGHWKVSEGHLFYFPNYSSQKGLSKAFMAMACEGRQSALQAIPDCISRLFYFPNYSSQKGLSRACFIFVVVLKFLRKSLY